MDIVKDLFSMRDEAYRAFNSSLLPSVDSSLIIGVRTPLLKKYAKSIKENCVDFLDTLPHTYYEENNLHAFLLNDISDFDECVKRVNEFLPFVDNWGTCDGLRPKCFGKNKDKLMLETQKWLKSHEAYTVRFGIEMLMVHFLDDDFDKTHLKAVSEIVSDEYYVNMMIAWYFATALAKRWDDAITFLEDKSLSVWVHNKTVQKAVESYRISHSQKEYLKTLRRTKK